MRPLEEDSSVAINAATLQEFGMMFEKDLPYLPSWFDKGYPCEDQRANPEVDSKCFAHVGPEPGNSMNIISGINFVFEAVKSSSIKIVQSLAQHRNPVTISILGHKDMWAQTTKTGSLFLTKKWIKECKLEPKLCSSHAALIVGYDLKKKVFTFKNSWGDQWGQAGYDTISFNYIDQMSERNLLTGYLIGPVNLPKSDYSHLLNLYPAINTLLILL